MEMDEVSELHDALPNSQTNSCHVLIHIEVCQNPCSTAQTKDVKAHVEQFLPNQLQNLHSDLTITQFDAQPFLKEHVLSINICGDELKEEQGDNAQLGTHIHVFKLNQDGPGQEEIEEEELAAANQWILPAKEFHGLWESLVYDDQIKEQLLHYAETTNLFSEKMVDPNIISWNRVILLHGPPGTGKTSLCKALAQKLVIRTSDRYSYGQLIEINSHSLFSKWFSESGKLVMKMFAKISELIEDPEALVFVLIDEVESLTAARSSAMAGSEPSDAIRVVNALLTQLDQIRQYPNVIILTTSNITGAIDAAFVDRADIKQYIGPPSANAIFTIYKSCIDELVKAGIINSGEQIFDLKRLQGMGFRCNKATHLSVKLYDIAKESQGLSGRTLRKLPFLSHALFLQTSTVSLEGFLNALHHAVSKQFTERSDLTKT